MRDERKINVLQDAWLGEQDNSFVTNPIVPSMESMRANDLTEPNDKEG